MSTLSPKPQLWLLPGTWNLLPSADQAERHTVTQTRSALSSDVLPTQTPLLKGPFGDQHSALSTQGALCTESACEAAWNRKHTQRLPEEGPCAAWGEHRACPRQEETSSGPFRSRGPQNSQTLHGHNKRLNSGLETYSY